MAREALVAVIGGNKLPKIAPSARLLGEVLSDKAILLTGGEPNGPSADIKNAAMNGCRDAGGLMISVLPNGPRSCVVSGRRLILRTGLKPLERDPITGAAADVVVVLSGGRGTLVELAYAALKRRPVVFMSSLDDLTRARLTYEGSLTRDFEKACHGYPLIDVQPAQLRESLKECLSSSNQHCVDTAGEAVEEVLKFIRRIDRLRPSNFLGLPGEANIQAQFEGGVLVLSRLR